MEHELINFYKDLFTDPYLYRSSPIEKITQHIPSLVTDEKNAALLRPISIEEVDQATKEILTRKSLGLDGFTNNFSHHCYHFVMEEVWQLLEDSWISLGFLPSLNATFLTLFPKEERVSHPKYFQPITLCNVIYKIITKVMTLSLKPLLPFITSQEKLGYVQGRQILDSVILSHEVIHSLKYTCTHDMIIKLYLSKYFNKLNLKYMRSLLLAFVFFNDLVN